MSRPILLIITYLLLTTSTECPDKCRCSRYKTTCKGNIPRTYSNQTEELTITYANITELTSHSFNSTELSNLIKLQISRSDVNNIQDDAFCGLKQLRTLDLSRNKIRNITSKTFNCLEKLLVLTLQINKIEQLSLRTFESLTSLRKFTLTYNFISILSPGWYMKNDLISEIDMELGNSTMYLLEENEEGAEKKKKKIDLELISLGYNSIKLLERGTFQNLQTVKYLYLYNNKIISLSSGCFEGLDSVELLDISRNSITNLESGTFHGLRNLKYLSLADNKIKILRFHAFKFACNIIVINLLKNAITTIEKGAFWNLSKLRELSLIRNQVNKLGTPEETDVVSSNDLHNLSSLNNIKLEEYETSPLGTESFSKLYYLKILHLHYNAITKLSRGTFRDLHQLQTLKLSDNNICEIERGTFIGLSKLKDLDLSSNNLTNLKNDTFDGLYLLKRLNLYNNNLESLDADLFLGLTSLKRLSLGRNKLTSIPEGLFKDTIRLDILALHKNSELLLGPDSLRGLDTLRHLQFHINSTFSPMQAVQNVPFLYTVNVEVFGTWSNYIELKRLEAHKLILDINIKSPTLECDSFRNLENLESLSLGSANISKIQKGAFKLLKLVTYLNLAANKISSLLPGTFEGLMSLQSLHLTNNLITKLDRAVFSVSDLFCVQDDERNLRRLCHKKEDWVRENTCVQSKLLKVLLPRNKIQYIHPHAFLGSEQLQVLFLSDNFMLTLEEKFLNLPSLQFLYISNCNVSEVTVHTFECAPNLKEVILELNSLHNLDIDAMRNLKNLETFRVSQDKIECNCANIEILIWMQNHGIRSCERHCSVCTELPRFRSLEHLYQYLNCSPPVEISELSRSTSLNLDMFKRYIEPSILSIIFLTGLVGNGLLLYIFVSRPDMRSGANACILNLALGDFLSLVVNLPLSYWDNQNDKWQLGLATCKLFMGVKDLTVGVTVFSVVALSVQRHSVTVQAVHTSTSSTRGILLTILVVWGLSVGFALPAFFTATVDTRCLYSAAVDHYVRLTWTMQLFIYCVVPVVIIVIRYVQVARHLRQSVANMPGETVAARQARGRSRLANMVIVLTFVFCLSYIPNFLLRVLCVWSMFDPESQFIFFLSFVSFCLFFCNSCFNPIALFCTSSRFRAALFDILHLKRNIR